MAESSEELLIKLASHLEREANRIQWEALNNLDTHFGGATPQDRGQLDKFVKRPLALTMANLRHASEQIRRHVSEKKKEVGG